MPNTREQSHVHVTLATTGTKRAKRPKPELRSRTTGCLNAQFTAPRPASQPDRIKKSRTNDFVLGQIDQGGISFVRSRLLEVELVARGRAPEMWERSIALMFGHGRLDIVTGLGSDN